MAKRTKVAILGGGPAALAAAFELTRDSRPVDVTIYQPGWRLGGKCASGRNLAEHHRIEEHGLHVWFGCYDNARELMARCYEEVTAGPIRCWGGAFEAVPSATLWEFGPGEGTWVQIPFPDRKDDAPRDFRAWALLALDWAKDRTLALMREAYGHVHFLVDPLDAIRRMLEKTAALGWEALAAALDGAL